MVPRARTRLGDASPVGYRYGPFEEGCDPANGSNEWATDQIGPVTTHARNESPGKETEIGQAALGRAPAQRREGWRLGHQRILSTEGVVGVAGPRPIAGVANHARSDGVHVPVDHDLEFMEAAALDTGRAEALHDDLPAASSPYVVPTGEALVDHLPERAERRLTEGRAADEVRVGPHQTVTVDEDSVPVLVLGEKAEEFPTGVVRIQDPRAVVASPEAMVG